MRGKMDNENKRSGQKCTHGELIQLLLQRDADGLPGDPVFVETGCGISTLYLAEAGKYLKAKVYSCDFNGEKVRALQEKAGERVANVEFIIGDSMQALQEIGERHARIHFLFLDAAASAMHTFEEFMLIQHALGAGSTLLIDNAAVPGATSLLSPCRKGKIIVPYLQAHANWQVLPHPRAGDAMVSAKYFDEQVYADPDY